MILASHGLIASQIQSFVGLLDLYPSAAAAYSLRKLRAAYSGSAIRVRRSSDNAEQNIGFDATGNLDTSALTTFCSGTNGFVTTWYDQSGNGRDILQNIAIQQPIIVSSGSLITMSGTGSSFPCIQFDGVNDILTISNSFMNTYPLSIFTTLKASNSINRIIFTGANSVNDSVGIGAGSSLLSASSFKYNGTFNEAVVSNVFANNKIGLVISIYDNLSNNYFTYGNNSNSISNSNTKPTLTNFSIGSLNRTTPIYYASITNEVIVYPSNETTNKNNINTNINTYYGIY